MRIAKLVSLLIPVAGVACITVGVAMISVPASLVTLGVLLVVDRVSDNLRRR